MLISMVAMCLPLFLEHGCAALTEIHHFFIICTKGINMKKLRIVFMGTPEFAVHSLHALHQSEHEIVGVITSTDKLGGRGGKKVIQSAVKKYAIEQELNILQPPNLKNPAFLEELKALNADLQFVVAFRMLPALVWDMPPLGTYNLHGSLLPKYRGAAPINWAVINGDIETGVTSFKLKHEIDTGDIVIQRPIPIGLMETAGNVHDKMMHVAADVVVETARRIANDELTFLPQDESLVSKAPKIFHDTCKIDFNQNTQTIFNFIRGLSPYPAAWTMLDEKQLDIYEAHAVITDHNLKPGQIQTDQKKQLRFATKDGFIEVKQLKLQGRKKMDVNSFLNGYKIASN